MSLDGALASLDRLGASSLAAAAPLATQELDELGHICQVLHNHRHTTHDLWRQGSLKRARDARELSLCGTRRASTIRKITRLERELAEARAKLQCLAKQRRWLPKELGRLDQLLHQASGTWCPHLPDSVVASIYIDIGPLGRLKLGQVSTDLRRVLVNGHKDLLWEAFPSGFVPFCVSCWGLLALQGNDDRQIVARAEALWFSEDVPEHLRGAFESVDRISGDNAAFSDDLACIARFSQRTAWVGPARCRLQVDNVPDLDELTQLVLGF